MKEDLLANLDKYDKDKRQLKTSGLAMTKFEPYISDSFKTSIKDLF